MGIHALAFTLLNNPFFIFFPPMIYCLVLLTQVQSPIGKPGLIQVHFHQMSLLSRTAFPDSADSKHVLIITRDFKLSFGPFIKFFILLPACHFTDSHKPLYWICHFVSQENRRKEGLGCGLVVQCTLKMRGTLALVPRNHHCS